MTTPDPDSPVPRRLFKPRVILLLLFLFTFICASVILTDHFSPRDRPSNSPTTHKGPLP